MGLELCGDGRMIAGWLLYPNLIRTLLLTEGITGIAGLETIKHQETGIAIMFGVRKILAGKLFAD